MRSQRDLYAHFNNQILHLANQGVTVNQIHNEYELPKSLQQKWECRGYHGSVQHNARAVVNRYLGYWDCNPATLIPLSPEQSAPLYVDMMGGAAKILERGQQLHDEGKYLLASEILDKLVQAEPTNQAAKDLLADVFEQIGYQQENPGLRNSFLAGSYELRSGIPDGASPKSSGPDVIRAMSTELFLNFLAIRMDSRKAENLRFTINLITPDNGEKFVIELENATLTNLQGFLAAKPDLTLTINRKDLEQTMMGVKTLESQIKDGTAKVQGDVSILAKLAATMVDFDPSFEIMPGTKPRAAGVKHADAYEAVPGKTIVE
jgi:alkyl sulfatase BDS1-like metallo-beta-lactamase superfamily hydrolase